MTYTNHTPDALDLSFLDGYRLRPEHLQEEPAFLVEGFLVKKTLSMFFAKGGQGKSYLMLALSLKLLAERKLRTVLYLDMDNSLVSLKKRGLDTIIENNPKFRYIHSSQIKTDPFTIINELIAKSKNEANFYEDCLIVMDSIRDFIVGRDMNSDREIGPVMERLKALRAKGATVIFLHHTTKEGDGKTYKGSSSFRDSVDVSYALSSVRKSNQLSFLLELDKDRLGVDEQVAFELNTESMELMSKNFALAVISESKRKFIESVQDVLTQNSQGVNQTTLLESIGKTSDDKTARKYLQEFSPQFWTIQKVPSKNNVSFYFPILPDLLYLPESV